MGPLPQGPTLFPRYSIGPIEDFQAICSLFETDFWHAAGHDVKDPRLVIDFDSIIGCL
jgi:hypothetical protein